jgi:hypothetical protein
VAEFEVVEERLISGVGVLRIPPDKKKNRMAILYLDVIREPFNKYLNKNWNPSKGRYAFLTYLRNGYVIGTADMEFDRQSYEVVSDISGQTMLAVKCAFNATIASIADLATALGVNVSIAPSPIKDFENLNLLWDEVRIKCYADTAIQARLMRLEYDKCNPDDDKQRRPPPPPPPLPRVPPRTPIGSIDPPYEEDDITDPYEGDETEPENPDVPPTEPCVKYAVFIRVYSDWIDPTGVEGGNPYVDVGREVWGEVFGVVFSRNSPAYVGIECQGLTTSPCGERQTVQIFSGVPRDPYPDPIILSITPLP